MSVRTARLAPDHLDVYRRRAVDRPRFRGVLHALAFAAAIPLGVVLVATSPSGRTAFAAAVFAFSAALMLGISALFHRGIWTDAEWYRMRKLDQTGIFLQIAGGYTAVAMLGIDGWQRPFLLIGGWSGVLAGIVLVWTPFKPPRGMMNGVFIVVGWLSVIAAPAMWRGLGFAGTALLVGGGLVYTLGAFILGARRPDPWPDVFGFHEIWHALVVVAVVLHYCLVAFVLIR